MVKEKGRSRRFAGRRPHTTAHPPSHTRDEPREQDTRMYSRTGQRASGPRGPSRRGWCARREKQRAQTVPRTLSDRHPARFTAAGCLRSPRQKGRSQFTIWTSSRNFRQHVPRLCAQGVDAARCSSNLSSASQVVPSVGRWQIKGEGHQGHDDNGSS